MGLGDAEEGAGGAFGAAVALFPVLEGAGTDANQGGELNLAEAELFAHGFGIGPLECRAARGILFATKNGTALLEAGDQLLQEFVFHRGYDSQFPQPFQRLEDLLNLLDPRLGAFAEVGGEGGGVGAGGGEELLDGGDLGRQGRRPGRWRGLIVD
jgi:hypothetical protein